LIVNDGRSFSIFPTWVMSVKNAKLQESNVWSDS
jgi:hypothetical protein